MPSKTVLGTLRASLETERDSLRAQLVALGAGPDGPSFDENFADSGQVAAEQGEVKAIAASLTDQLTDVERALGKLEGGAEGDEYGTCEVCGKVIAAARLEAMPATRFCIDHA